MAHGIQLRYDNWATLGGKKKQFLEWINEERVSQKAENPELVSTRWLRPLISILLQSRDNLFDFVAPITFLNNRASRDYVMDITFGLPNFLPYDNSHLLR